MYKSLTRVRYTYIIVFIGIFFWWYVILLLAIYMSLGNLWLYVLLVFPPIIWFLGHNQQCSRLPPRKLELQNHSWWPPYGRITTMWKASPLLSPLLIFWWFLNSFTSALYVYVYKYRYVCILDINSFLRWAMANIFPSLWNIFILVIFCYCTELHNLLLFHLSLLLFAWLIVLSHKLYLYTHFCSGFLATIQVSSCFI